MQPLARDGLTDVQVDAALRKYAGLVIDRGLEVLDLNLNVLDDISKAFLAGTVSRNSLNTIHGQCSLQILDSVSIELGRNLLRPYVTIQSRFGPIRFNMGVYCPSRPTRNLGDVPATQQYTGFSRLAQLYRPVGRLYATTPGATVGEEILRVYGLAGVTADHVRLDGTSLATPIPAPMVWPLLADPNATNPVPVDAVADDSNATTFLRILNALGRLVGYRGVWDDWDGTFRGDSYIDPAVKTPDYALDFDDPAFSIVALQRSSTLDVTQIPNVWIFVQSNLADDDGNPIMPTEGAGQYTVVNELDGPTSIAARGGGTFADGRWSGIGVVTSVVQLDAANQAFLEISGQQQIAKDQQQIATFAYSTSPFPAAWHEDVVSYSDKAMGATSLKLQSTSWTFDFGNSTEAPALMTHQAVQAA